MYSSHSLGGRVLLAATISLIVVFIAGACGGGSDNEASPNGSGATASASPADQAPLDVVRATLDELNRGDVDAGYANLSSEARKEVSLEDVRRVINGLRSAGVSLTVTIDRVGNQEIAGDFAEIDLTLSVQLGETKVPVDDTSSLVREDGAWKISDHFIQTALTAVGLATPLSQGPRRLDDNGCATGDPMQGVYAPSRLKILDPCLTVTGTVRNDIVNAQDGDITFGLYLSDADKQRLVNDVNIANYDGALHIEIVPQDQARVATPKPGDRVTVTGPWVTDLAHGHNEIHPAFKIEPAE